MQMEGQGRNTRRSDIFSAINKIETWTHAPTLRLPWPMLALIAIKIIRIQIVYYIFMCKGLGGCVGVSWEGGCVSVGRVGGCQST